VWREQFGCRGAVGQIPVVVSCVSRTVGQCKQEAQRCLTHRSSGAPTSRRTGHQAQGLRPILRLLSSAPRCWLPLTSNVRQHTQALWRASISIQIQRVAAVGSIQSAAPLFCRICPGRGQAKNMSCQQCSAHVLRRSRVLPLVCLQAKPKSLQLVAMHVSPVVGAKRPLLSASHRIAKPPAKKVVVAFSAWSLGVARAAWLSGRGGPNPGGSRLRFSYSRGMQARSEALPNPSVKRSANIASHRPSSAGPAAHFALAVQRATLLATAYLTR
jgi:hypothetical protein